MVKENLVKHQKVSKYSENYCSLCDYSDAYILVKGKITITGAGADAAARQADERDKVVAFKNCAPFTNSISEINNSQIDNAKYFML